ncbi:MAG: PST family polysaccharide transporter [Mariniblastus sp.]|jgi:PST family polysaccharide transporter
MATVSSQSQSKLLDADEHGAERGFVSDSIAAGVVFALAVTVGQRIVGFGRGILFCRMMSDQELGQWSMVWSYLMLLAPLAVLGLPGCFGKFTEHYRQRGQLQTFIGRISILSIVLTLLMSGLILAFPVRVSWILFRDPSQVGLVRLLAVALVVVTASNFMACLMESLRQVRTVTIMRFVAGLMFAVAGVGMLMVWENGSSAATFAFGLSCLVGMVPGVWVLWKCRSGIRNDGATLTQTTMWKRIAPFAIWLWASNLLNNLFEVSDRYMLIHWSNLESGLAQGAVGQYHSGRVVPLLMVSVAAMLAGVLMPYLSQAWEAGEREKATKQLKWTVKLVSIAFTAGGVLVLLFSPILFDSILQGRYDDGLAILPLTLVYCIWFGLMSVSQDYLWVAEQGKWATLANGLGLIVNVVLNMILIPTIGLQGAVIATAIGNATLVILMTALNQRFGCKADIGIWMCLALPMLLLLSKPVAVLLMLIAGVICIGTNLILSADEKSELIRVAEDKFGKFLPGK